MKVFSFLCLAAASVCVAATPDPLMTVTNESGVVQIAAPTFRDVTYGGHPKQVLHVWKAESARPAPLLVFIHGGSWTGGSRTDRRFCALLPDVLKAGISVASVEYRFIQEATADKVEPPVRGCLLDAARAVQFLRSKAGEWNIDKARVALSGGSAGACTSLWLAFHDDLADPKSADPVARESTRVLCAAVAIAQTTLDPQQMREWTPNSVYGGHAFGISVGKNQPAFDAFLEQRERLLPWIAEYSPYALVSKDDPPVYLWYGTKPALGQPEKDPTHTANFGVKLQERCKALGVLCELNCPGATDVAHKTVLEYLVSALTEGRK
jgi:acetyl esterase/lipase